MRLMLAQRWSTRLTLLALLCLAAPPSAEARSLWDVVAISAGTALRSSTLTTGTTLSTGTTATGTGSIGDTGTNPLGGTLPGGGGEGVITTPTVDLCPNGTIDTAAGETCDRPLFTNSCQSLGNKGGTITCDPDCHEIHNCNNNPVCQDGVKDLGEDCDDGNAIDGDGCQTDCTLSQCTTGQSASCSTTNTFGTCNGSKPCTEGVWGTCTAATPAAEICDEQDNDCDGAVDEGFDVDADGVIDCLDACPRDSLKSASIGACGCGVSDKDGDKDGTPDCKDQCAADPWKVAPGMCGCSVSDKDDDGDGTPNCDDACPADPLKLAAGVCGCGKAETDVDGDGIPNCNDNCPDMANVEPSPELCGNDQDDDCDGEIDEGFDDGTICWAGRGACERSGEKVCFNDMLSTICSVVAGEPGAEICDGLDNDCDDQIDEEVQKTFYKDNDKDGYGGNDFANLCKPGDGYTATISDCDDSNPAIHAAAIEICDGTDNDCDGAIDEALPTITVYDGLIDTAGVGPCKAGTQSCRDGQYSFAPGATPVLPTREQCDGIDNNCNGRVDEKLVQDCATAPADTLGTGICKGGQQKCIGGAWSLCDGATVPLEEICGNDIDEDCSGADLACAEGTDDDTGDAVVDSVKAATDEAPTWEPVACASNFLNCKGQGVYLTSIKQTDGLFRTADGTDLLLFGRDGTTRQVVRIPMARLMGKGDLTATTCQLTAAADYAGVVDAGPPNLILYTSTQYYLAPRATAAAECVLQPALIPASAAACQGTNTIRAVIAQHDINGDKKPDAIAVGDCLEEAADEKATGAAGANKKLAKQSVWFDLLMSGEIGYTSSHYTTTVTFQGDSAQPLQLDAMLESDGAITALVSGSAESHFCQFAVVAGAASAPVCQPVSADLAAKKPIAQIAWNPGGPGKPASEKVKATNDDDTTKVDKDTSATEEEKSFWVTQSGTLCDGTAGDGQAGPPQADAGQGKPGEAGASGSCAGGVETLGAVSQVASGYLEPKDATLKAWPQNILYAMLNGIRLGTIPAVSPPAGAAAPAMVLLPKDEEFLVPIRALMTWNETPPDGMHFVDPGSLVSAEMDEFGGEDLLVAFHVVDDANVPHGITVAWYPNKNETPTVVIDAGDTTTSDTPTTTWTFSAQGDDPTDDTLTHQWTAVDANGADVSNLLDATTGAKVILSLPEKPTSWRFELIPSAFAADADIAWPVTVTVTSCDKGGACSSSSATVKPSGEVDVQKVVAPPSADAAGKAAADAPAVVGDDVAAPPDNKAATTLAPSDELASPDDGATIEDAWEAVGGCSLLR